jgi:hypothetical protein
MTRALSYLANHALPLTALGCALLALGGASYAALTVPPGSVNQRAIRNHAIDPVKFDPRFITGSVRAWAVVSSGGRVIAGGGRPHVGSPPIPGSYEIGWGVQFKRNCATVATIDANRSPTTEQIAVPGNPAQRFTAGYAVAASSRSSSGRGVTFVTTFNQQGALTALGFDVTVIC